MSLTASAPICCLCRPDAVAGSTLALVRGGLGRRVGQPLTTIDGRGMAEIRFEMCRSIPC